MIFQTIKIILFLYLFFFFFLSLSTILCGEQKSIQSSVNGGRVSIQRFSATWLNIGGEETDVGEKAVRTFSYNYKSRPAARHRPIGASAGANVFLYNKRHPLAKGSINGSWTFRIGLNGYGRSCRSRFCHWYTGLFYSIRSLQFISDDPTSVIWSKTNSPFVRRPSLPRW